MGIRNDGWHLWQVSPLAPVKVPGVAVGAITTGGGVEAGHCKFLLGKSPSYPAAAPSVPEWKDIHDDSSIKKQLFHKFCYY